MKIKIIVVSFFLILLIGCAQEIKIQKELNKEKLRINDFNETLNNFEFGIAKIVNISNYQCAGGHSGSSCYVDFTLKGHEEQKFKLGISTTYGGQIHYREQSYEKVIEDFKRQIIDLENKDCICTILDDDISYECICGQFIHKALVIYKENYYASWPETQIRWDINRITLSNSSYIGRCVKVEFKNYNEIAYLSNVNIKEFEWLEIVDCVN